MFFCNPQKKRKETDPQTSLRMKFPSFYSKSIQKYFWKTIDFVKNLKMTQIEWGEGGMTFFASLWRNAYVIHP